MVGLIVAAVICLGLGVLLAAFRVGRLQPQPPGEVITAIERHFASQGTVMLIRPVLISYGRVSPGSGQYDVQLTTALGLSRDHRVEVDASGRVQVLL